MSLFQAAENRANSKTQQEKIRQEYNDIKTPEDKLEFLLALREGINNNNSVANLSLALSFLHTGKTYGQWIKGEIALQKEKIDLRKYLNQEKDRLEDQGKENNLPDPHEVAKQFYQNPFNKLKKYEPHEIEPVMKATREYIINNGVENISGHVHTIYKEIKNSNGSKNAQKKWIKTYAEHAGLKCDKA